MHTYSGSNGHQLDVPVFKTSREPVGGITSTDFTDLAFFEVDGVYHGRLDVGVFVLDRDDFCFFHHAVRV